MRLPPRAALWATTILALPMSGMALAQEASAPAAPQESAIKNSEDGVVTLDKVTIYATRQSTNVSDAPASITVVEGAALEARGQDNLQQMTRYIPGVTVSRQTSATDPFATFGGVNIRGVGGNRVQMLIDGSRVAERITDGTRDYFDFNFIKQVDVVKGPSSVLWGSDALGGVVAFTTIDPEDVLQGQDRAGTGRLSYDSLNGESGVSAAFAQRFSPDLTALLGIARTDAHEAKFRKARADGGVAGCERNIDYGAPGCNELNPADIAANRLLAKLVWTPSSEHRLAFTADFLQRDTDVQYNVLKGPVYSSMTGLPTGEVNFNHDRNLEVRRQHFSLTHTWTPGSGFVDEVRTTFAYTPYSYKRTGTKWSRNAAGQNVITRDRLDYSEDFFELDVQATSRFSTGSAEHELTWGFDGDLTHTDYARVDRVQNLTTGTDEIKRAGGFNFANSKTRRADLYVQDKISLLNGQLELTPGLRFASYRIEPNPDKDYIPVIGKEPKTRSDSKVLGNFGALYRINDTYKVWANYGQGFKMPTAQQLYTSVPGASFDMIPAPDLRPEEVKSFELGLRRETAQSYFGVTAFRADYTDFIQSFWNPPGTNVYTYRNIGKVKTWGLELEGRYDLADNLSLTGSAAWMKGRQKVDEKSEETPQDLPPLTATLGLSWEARPDLTLDLMGTVASRIRETATKNNFKAPGYGVVDAYASWKVTDTAVLNLGVKNLFDKRYFYDSASGYSVTPSRSVGAQNPLELQTAPGRFFTASLEMKF
ncbi:TonB-dependent hemoglobin/transferrin/lactoferrin family receptor [Paracoccus aminophilus]|uniref:TonB-dependent receptor n=1 Tax=Paracoccus aminophilus JCM 7686 TaxID=1367847 RepID=S5Y4M8_PARAH|nr:TonB-dependent hemoglobin/transferrin/lactoferrin family receptor [Paracoccus aminophilus]AGT10695.1 TonB-dependent receptor [Paracoccus aminophilus JCM 7686]